MTSDGTWNYTYGSAGNMIGKVGISNNLSWAFTYNNANRVISAVETDTSTQTVLQSVSYIYDVFGNRLSQSVTINGTTTVTNFASTPDGTLFADLDSGGTIQTRYIAGAGGADTWLARVTTGSHAYWLLSDYQGSITLVVDQTGAVADSLVYDAWGNITSETTPSERGALGFQGGRYDAVTGNWNFGVRVYDPTRRDWTTQDPEGFRAGDSNLQRFVENGPTNGVDPSGKYTISELFEKLGEHHSESLKLFAEYLLDYGGWSFVTQDIEYEDIEKGFIPYNVGRLWRQNNKDIDGDISTRRIRAMEGRKYDIAHNDNRWIVDYTNKLIWVNSSGLKWGSDYLAEAIGEILKRADQAAVTADTINENAAKMNGLKAGAMVTAADPAMMQDEARKQVTPMIIDLGVHVGIEVGSQLGGSFALRGVFWMLKQGYRLAGPAVLKGGRTLIKFTRPAGQVPTTKAVKELNAWAAQRPNVGSHARPNGVTKEMMRPGGELPKPAAGEITPAPKSGNAPGTGAAPQGPPPLKSIHPDSSLRPSSLDFWGKKSTQEIIDSLKPGQKDALLVYTDGRIAQGNTRIKILRDRGVDVDKLPREIHKPDNSMFPDLKD